MPDIAVCWLVEGRPHGSALSDGCMVAEGLWQLRFGLSYMKRRF